MNAGGVPGLSASDEAALNQRMAVMQAKDSLVLYNNLIEMCFKDCVNGFKSKNLESDEQMCTQRCVEKFMKHSQRVGQRFAEFQAQQDDAQGMAAMGRK